MKRGHNDMKEIQGIIKSYLRFYSTKLEDINGAHDFLNGFHLLKLHQDQVNYLNSPISSKEIETAISSLPAEKKFPRSDSFSILLNNKRISGVTTIPDFKLSYR